MMNTLIFNRVVLNAASAVLILLGLAYWWLGNVAHELFGVGLFLLLGRHVYMKRFWFSNLFRGRYTLRRSITTALHLMLLVGMLVMLVTSALISESLRAWLGLPNMFMFREIHWFAAYWTVVIVGLHIGLNWNRVTSVMQVKRPEWTRAPAATFAVWLSAVAIAAFAMWSVLVLGLGTKLSFGYSIEFWDFSVSVLPFFLHWFSVVAVAAIASHVFMKFVRLLDRRTAE